MVKTPLKRQPRVRSARDFISRKTRPLPPVAATVARPSANDNLFVVVFVFVADRCDRVLSFSNVKRWSSCFSMLAARNSLRAELQHVRRTNLRTLTVVMLVRPSVRVNSPVLTGVQKLCMVRTTLLEPSIWDALVL